MKFRLIATSAILGLLPAFAMAQTGLIPDCAQQSSAPTIYCGLEALIGVGRFLFGIMGAAALVMFVAGGFFMVAAGGRDAWVKKGKEYVKNAVIGIVIILLAAYAIQYGYDALRTGTQDGAPDETGASFIPSRQA